MNSFRQPGAVTMVVTILITCLVLFLFQKVILLVVPGLLALMIYYCLRPLVEWLVLRGVRHEIAAMGTAGLVLVITIGIVFISARPLLTRVGQLQSSVDHYI